MTIRSRLIFCLSFLALALAVMAGSSFIAMTSIAERTRTIVRDRVVPMDQLKIVADEYAVDIVDAVHKIRSGAFSLDQGTQVVGDALSAIDTQWSAYEATEMTPEEKRLAGNFLAARTATGPAIAQLVAILAAKDMTALAKFADEALYPAIDPLSGPISDLMKLQIRVANEEFAAAETAKRTLTWVMGTIAAIAAIIIGLSVWVVLRGVLAPMRHLQTAMLTLAGGDLDTTVYGEGRKDEIGQMASAVSIFRDNALERVRLEADADSARHRTDAERIAREAEKARDDAAIRFAVDSLAGGLSRLADGALETRLDAPFTEQLDALRINFNTSVTTLERTLTLVGDNARGIEAGAQEIRSAADDLSRRTEQQAASVEETAAALEQISTTLQDSSQRAAEAGRLVAQTRAAAETSGDVVTKAIGAMNSIEKSSSEITNIIGVIDDIAFQTNLLALNAGVEAARAGDAGKGFAVVAQEVRELAQRSAKAAKEIKELINTSSQQVRSGVSLVDETGRTLETIITGVKEINVHVAAIVQASKEQAVGIREINTAVNTLDQGTQQNAAMVEQSTAASHGLTSAVRELNQLLDQFSLSQQGAGERRPMAAAYTRAA